jgi:hypothetical protein
MNRREFITLLDGRTQSFSSGLRVAKPDPIQLNRNARAELSRQLIATALGDNRPDV